MTFVWAKKHNTVNKYLGGMQWDEITLVFNYHPPFMVLGFLLCFGWAITSFRTTTLEKPVNKNLHVLLHTCCIVCIGIGLRAVWKSHDDPDASSIGPTANVYSLHSWIGITTITLYAQNYLLGFLTYLFPEMPIAIKKMYMPLHVVLGQATFACACAAMETGIVEKQGFQGGCSYNPQGKDENPAVNYQDIPYGCHLSNGIGVVILMTMLCMLVALNRDADSKPEQDNLKNNLSEGLI